MHTGEAFMQLLEQKASRDKWTTIFKFANMNIAHAAYYLFF